VRARTAPLNRQPLDVELPGWDYADSFQVPVGPNPPSSAGEAATAIFRPSPAGRVLMRLRDALVAPAGLHPSSPADTGVLPVLRMAPLLCVLGMDDRHLDFRVLIELDRDVVRCTSVVRRHNQGGRLYFAVVRPFHRLAVPRLLARTAARGWPTTVQEEENHHG
jgi:Protein of unknown function (DUF2867)